jgi:hypothetical protein
MRRAARRGLLAVVAAASACSHSRVESCDANLGGVWIAGDGARWMMIDLGDSLEAYPMFPDALGPTDMVTAPRFLDLHRTEAGLEGKLGRRYMRGPDACEARAPVHVTACKDNALELALTDLAPPLAFAPCRWPVAAPARLERWRRRD